ncbi:hypothetical protein [Methylocystis sp.]|uniref:hypothetical protein n=1 Tax=Methylocystis sp. TaxID=1911079 RepID=UPI0025E6EEAA|nr:hypothetical protein [Methylocystis sp.]
MTPVDEIRRELAAQELAIEELRAALATAEAAERTDAIESGLALYEGELWTRASALAVDLRSYAGNGWRREHALASLADSAPSKRRAWHRILRSSRGGAPIGARRISDLAKLKFFALPISTRGM